MPPSWAVGEGRRIYDNIRKAIQFLLGSNMSEVLSVFTATLLGFTLLNPVHLLFINLITDCFPSSPPLRWYLHRVLHGGAGYFEMLKGVSDDGMTMASLTMSMCEIFHSFNMRSQRRSIQPASHNKVLWLAMIKQVAADHRGAGVPFIANAFRIYAGELDDARSCAGSGGAGDQVVERS